MMIRLILGVGLMAAILGWWKKADHTVYIANQSIDSADRAARSDGWHFEEKEHRRWEKRYWLSSVPLSLTVAIGAGASALYAYKAVEAGKAAVMEAHEQALQAKRQANIAENQLIATTRARLKLVTITDAYVSRGADADVAWFNFKPLYKNFGPSPAEQISFIPHIFVVGGGPSTDGDICKAGSGWMRHDASSNIVYPQDDGGDRMAVQVPLQELKAEAGKVLAIQPNAVIYLGVVGCLLYNSGIETDKYMTGIVADLHMAGKKRDDPNTYIPLYDVLVSGVGVVQVQMDVKILSAWAN